MSSKIRAIRSQFNRSAAGSYDTHAHVQRKMAGGLAEALTAWKDESGTDRINMLEIGCGTGTLTEILYTEWPCSSITALDIAPAMIDAAEQRLRSNYAGYSNNQPARLHFLHADIEEWAADCGADSFDLIVSNACFQWLSNPRQTLGHLRRMLRPGGLLLFTTFGPDTFYELHEAFNEVYKASGLEPQRHGLLFQSMAQWRHSLDAAGFSNIHSQRAIQTETYASVRDFLHSVKATGASASEASTVSGISPRRLFANMYKEYEHKFSIQGGVAATYDLVFVQASVY
ncbi:malonyl-ACP O-methyltransferase BioC [Paenibacillus sp. SI8]|uniref:malonyl-ACP O-methyltransferase BioC n=1 Tax=unclassified Paenibacillus TaxID=185978 RepID=UPI003467233C